MNREMLALLGSLVFSGSVHGSAQTCRADQLGGAAALCQKALQCEATYSKNSARGSAAPVRDRCLARARSGFVRTYSRALAKESRRGGECVLHGDANAVAQNWLGGIIASGGLSDSLQQGRDGAARASRNLYASLLSGAAADCSGLLNAHGTDAKRPNPNRLARNLARNRNVFLLKSGRDIRRAEARGLAYQGQTPVALADSIEGYVNSVVDDTRRLPVPATALQIAPGTEHTCALLDTSRVKCWGRGTWGELGLEAGGERGSQPGQMGDALPPVDLGTGRSALEVAAGRHYSCARLDNGQVKCWGSNDGGALGLGTIDDLGSRDGEMGDWLPAVDLGSGRTAAGIAAGWAHTCAVLENGQIKCWGWNNFGQLGIGDTLNRGDGPGEMGDNLPVAELGAGQRAVQVSAGWSQHTCARLESGQVKCWGLNYSGQLGLGDTHVRGDEPGEMGDNLPAVDLGTGRVARDIAVGYDHSCAVLDNGQLKCWGGAGFGQLGIPNPPNNRGDDAGEMGNNLPAVDLGSGRYAVEVAAGDLHTCARLDNGQVKCWGANNRGQLGLGDEESRGVLPGEMGDNLPAVDLGAGRTAVEIAAGPYSTCARLDNGGAKCWGSNGYGQLGLGDNNYRGDAPGEMGDKLPAIDLGTR